MVLKKCVELNNFYKIYNCKFLFIYKFENGIFIFKQNKISEQKKYNEANKLNKISLLITFSFDHYLPIIIFQLLII